MSHFQKKKYIPLYDLNYTKLKPSDRGDNLSAQNEIQIRMTNILSKWRVKINDVLDNSTTQKCQHMIYLEQSTQRSTPDFFTTEAFKCHNS